MSCSSYMLRAEGPKPLIELCYTPMATLRGACRVVDLALESSRRLIEVF